jgi:sarcosine oxidase subunit gamma
MTDRDRYEFEDLLHGAMKDTAPSGVDIKTCPALSHINLRGNPENDEWVTAAESALGQPLPLDANTMTSGAHRIFWLGPDEWLILTESGASSLCACLDESLSGMHFAVNDLSGGQIALRVSGPGARDALAKGCTLDLHPRVFAAGMCAQSGLAKANVLLGLDNDAGEFDIVVRRSFADYLVRWLIDTSRA